jgi:site-specific DNA-methyltransferase (adenine-specific)
MKMVKNDAKSAIAKRRVAEAQGVTAPEMAALPPVLAVESWPVERVKPYPGNPRVNDGAVDAVAESIKRFGFRVPIIVDAEGVIVAGHTRLKAALKLGLPRVPVHQASDLDEASARALRIADNKTGEIADWDFELLPIELSALQELDWDLASLGFSDEELASLLESSASSGGATDADAVPEPDESEPPISQPGEMYALGGHRLLCGNAADADVVARLLNGRKIDLLFTDPPYGVSYADKNAFLNAADKGNRIQEEIENDHLSLEDTGKLWLAAFTAWAPHLADHSAYYVCTASSNGLLPLMLDTLAAAGMPYRHQLIWVKNCHVLGRSDYCYKHEPILYGWAKRHKFYGAGEQKFSVWEYPKPTANKLHPTMKPVALIENAILNGSEKGMLVADPFLGSGSTLIAAERTGRICVGTELEPKYCDVVRRRWAEHLKGEGCDWRELTPVTKD